MMSSDESSDEGTEQSRHFAEESSSSSDELSIQAIVERFMADLATGRADLDQLVDQYPQLQPELRKRLSVVQSLFDVFGDKHDLAEVDLISETEASPKNQLFSKQAERVRCPNCGIRLQIVETVRKSEYTCSSCGSNIRVEPDTTRTLSPDFVGVKIGRFELLEMVGRGGFGSVYRARDPDLSRDVAIKIPREGYFQTHNERERFLREARHAARLRHAHIVQVHEIGADEALPYIVTDFIDGLTLADLIHGQRISFRECAEMMIKVAEGVEFAHSQGVIHRDIKPSNVLLDEHLNPFIADFGLAKDSHENEITITLEGEVLGTVAYMSPEQAQGDVTAVQRTTDVYSMGVVLYKMLTGELPFQGSDRMMINQLINDEPRSVRRLNELIPRELDIITLKAIAKDPRHRYATAREFADDLRRWINLEPILARPISPFGKVKKWSKRRPLVATLSLSIVLLLFVGAGLLVTWAVRETALRRKVSSNLELAERNQRESEERLQTIYVQNGVERLAESDPLMALAWFDTALNSPNDHPQVHRLRIGQTLSRLPVLTNVEDAGSRLKLLKYSQDGEIILAVTADNQVKVFDHDSGQDIIPPINHQEVVQAAALDSTGSWLAIASGKQANLWRLETGKRIKQLDHEETVIACSFRADSSRLLTASVDQIAKIWSVPDAELQHTLQHELSQIRVAQFLGASDLIGTVTTNASITESRFVVWNSISGQRNRSISYPGRIFHVVSNEDGSKVAASSDSEVVTWRIPSGEKVGAELPVGSPLRQMSFLAEDRQLVTVAKNGTVSIWGLDAGTQLREEIRLESAASSVSISKDESFVAIAGADGKVQIRWLASGELVCGKLVHGSSAEVVAFHPNSRIFICSGNDGAIKQWDLSGVNRGVIRLQHEGEVLEARFGPEGKRVVTASRDKTGGLWRAASGDRIGAALGHDLDVLDCDFSENGQYVATASGDMTCKVWDAYLGTIIGSPKMHKEPVLRVAFSPDSKRLLTSTTTGKVYLWKIDQEDPVFVRECHEKAIYALAFHPDGGSFATGSSDGLVQVWDAETGARRWRPFVLEGIIGKCCFDSQGRWLAAASRNSEVAVWSIEEPTREPQLLEHRGPVTSCAFSSNGDELLTTDTQGGATLWELDSDRYVMKWREEFGSFTLTHGDIGPDSNIVAVCGARTNSYNWRPNSGVVFLLDAETATPLSPAIHHLRRVHRVHISPDGMAVVSSSLDYESSIWGLRPVLMESSVLRDYVQVLSGHEIDKRSRESSVNAKEQKRLFDKLKLLQPDLFQTSRTERESWLEYVDRVNAVSEK